MGNIDTFGILVNCAYKGHDRHASQITVLLIQSSQAGAGIFARGKLITADNRNIFGDTQALIRNGTDCTLGHRIIDTENCGRGGFRLFQSFCHGAVAVRRVVIT